MVTLNRRFSVADLLLAGGSLVVFIAGVFLPWFTASSVCQAITGRCVPTPSTSTSGFSGLGILALFGALVALGFFGVRTFADEDLIPQLPIEDGMIYRICAGLMVAGCVFALLTNLPSTTREQTAGALYTNTQSFAFGLFIALVAAFTALAGALQGGGHATRLSKDNSGYQEFRPLS